MMSLVLLLYLNIVITTVRERERERDYTVILYSIRTCPPPSYPNFVFEYDVQSLAFKMTVLRSTLLCLSIEFSLATLILYAKNCTLYLISYNRIPIKEKMK
jgi:hypothetical protein